MLKSLDLAKKVIKILAIANGIIKLIMLEIDFKFIRFAIKIPTIKKAKI